MIHVTVVLRVDTIWMMYRFYEAMPFMYRIRVLFPVKSYGGGRYRSKVK